MSGRNEAGNVRFEKVEGPSRLFNKAVSKAGKSVFNLPITPENDYKKWQIEQKKARRNVLKAALALPFFHAFSNKVLAEDGAKLYGKNLVKDNSSDKKLILTSESDATSYNNFYEFSTDKSEPARMAQRFKTKPWSIEFSGELKKPFTMSFDEFVANYDLHERVYRFRCVEAWAMNVPWIGVPLADVLRDMRPSESANYVRFETLHDPKRMPGQRRSGGIDWPYVEGLRMDEAMHPLTLLVVGMYGKPLPAQNGAPLRLMVPWKYGFKSIKSIVKISLTKEMPSTTWNKLAASEYGFYANVNPEVDHPRWSQKRERLLPSTLFNPNWQPTLKFNGYEAEVSDLYKGMDLAKHY